MIKQLIKSVLGAKNIARINRVRQAVYAAKTSWRNTSPAVNNQLDQLEVRLLVSVHMLEKALAVENMNYLNAIKYSQLIDNLNELLRFGMSPENFTIRECASVIKSALSHLSGHDEDKKAIDDFIAWNDVAADFRGGVERISSSEIFAGTKFDFGSFVRSRHSIRKFTDKIISREVIYDIVRDAEYYPSACNRQPCKVYFSENPDTVRRILTAHSDKFFSLANVHDCLIVTCDRALLSPAEKNDQELINGGIFLGYLVMSIHAHGLGSCLFQYLQVNSSQEKIRKEFGISSTEAIVAFVAIGELEDEVLCACSQRRPVEEVAIEI